MATPAPQTLTLDAALQQAIAHHRAGRLREAEQLYRAILQVQPDHAQAHHHLGVLEGQVAQTSTVQSAPSNADAPTPEQNNQLISLFNGGHFAELEAQALALLQKFPDSGFLWSILSGAMHLQGKDALHAFRKSAELAPDDAAIHHNLGNFLEDRGCADEAVASYRRALAIQPELADTHCNLGNVLRKLGRFEDAAASCKHALALNPNFAEAHFNLGNTERDLGRLDDAIASYRRAVALKPDFTNAHCNLGNVLRDRKQADAAVASYRRAIDIQPDLVEAHCNLGSVLRDLKQLDGAVASCRRALEIQPDWVEAHCRLGAVLYDLGQLDDAVASYRRAIAIDPGHADSHSNLGVALHRLEQADEAVASHLRAWKLQPGALHHAIRAHLMMPHIHASVEAMAAWRDRYQAGITTLMKAFGTLEDPVQNANPNSFALAYHHRCDRALMESLCRSFRHMLPALTTVSPHALGKPIHTKKDSRIRVGFLSEYLVAHTITKLFLGFIRDLDRNKFEVIVIHTPGATQDRFSQQVNQLADKVLTLPDALQLQQQVVMAEQLDVLFYPDIGMAPSTYFLAYARLAPVQAVGWGHPDTTGLDTMDYFVSGDMIEPRQAEVHYTEALIRLNRLPCCYYQAIAAPTDIPLRPTLGLPATGTLYGCPQSLYKFHPDFDGVLLAIAEGDPTGHIVLLEGKQAAMLAQIRTRWANSAPLLLERVVFMPPLDLLSFMGLIATMDVLLDPIYFGSGNTLYEAMVYGIPVVTWPSDFMRGRIVAGAYQQMGVADAPIAPRLEDYANLALALGRNPQRRNTLRQALQQAAARELFADAQAVREFEIFLEAALAAASRGEKLPSGWKPHPPSV